MFIKEFKLNILNGIRVLDFGRYIAGPYCAALLGDLGAEVIRVERIDGSEDRYIHPIGNPNGEGAMFMQMNRNKKGLTLNPTKDGSQEIVKKLIESADVVVANLPPQTRSGMFQSMIGHINSVNRVRENTQYKQVFREMYSRIKPNFERH